jgi:5-methylcytosine-specific restriction endonuclease McrA
MFDTEFIKRAQDLLEIQVEVARLEANEKKNRWNRSNPIEAKACRKKYESSEKGKEARQRVSEKRRERERNAKAHLTWKQKKEISNFYKNCPSGYVVDHIIPLAVGGLHELSNLQYLTFDENAKKGIVIYQVFRREC